jgi:predicted MFS family arabinose efflux permease
MMRPPAFLKFYTRFFEGLTRDTWYVSLVYLINRSGEMVIPFMSIYLTSQLGFTKTQSGIVLFCFGIGAMIGSNIGGDLSDKIGYYKVMALSLLGSAVAFLMILCFKDFYLLSGWMIVTAFFSSMFSPAAFSAVGDWEGEENMTRGFSLLRMAINLGIAIGPAVGGLLAHRIGYSWLFILDGLTCLFALGILYMILRHRNGEIIGEELEDEDSRSPYRDPVLMFFLFFNLINMVAFFQIIFAVPKYFEEVVGMNEFLVGLFFTANGILIFIFEMPIVYWIEESKKYFSNMAIGAILIGIGFFCLAIFGNPLMAIITYSLLIAIGEIINFPLLPTLCLSRSTPQNQGKYMGALSMMFSVAFILAPILGLPVVERIGYHTYWYIAGVLPIISGICLWYMRSYFKKVA